MAAPTPLAELDALGQMIRRGRETRGLTQDKLATLLGIGQSYMSEIEKGPASPDAVLMTRISEALGLSLIEVVHAATLRTERLKDRSAERPVLDAVDERGLDVVETVDFTDRKFTLPNPSSPDPDSSAA